MAAQVGPGGRLTAGETVMQWTVPDVGRCRDGVLAWACPAGVPGPSSRVIGQSRTLPMAAVLVSDPVLTYFVSSAAVV